MELAALLKTFLLIGHIIGVALGAGGATMSDVLFLTSIRDNAIDRSELKLLKIASKVVIGGLCLLMITGVGFFFVGTQPSQRFWAKMTIVAIASINGLIMHNRLFPVFERCAVENIPLLSERFTRHAPLMLVAGNISAISWYSAIILGTWRSLPLGYIEIMLVYILIMTITVGSSLTILTFVSSYPQRTQHFLTTFFPAMTRHFSNPSPKQSSQSHPQTHRAAQSQPQTIRYAPLHQRSTPVRQNTH